MIGYEKKYGTLSIPESKKEDFLHDVSLISDQAGLFAIRHMRVYDQEFDLLCFPVNNERSFIFDYSYFEDAQHERVTIDLNSGGMHSSNTESCPFGVAVQALYLVAESYSETCSHLDISPIEILRWLSYVLHRPVITVCRGHLWDVYEQFICDNEGNTKLSSMDIFNIFDGCTVDCDEISTIVYVNDAITEEYIENCLEQKEPVDKSSYGYWVRAMARFLCLAQKDSTKTENELLDRYMRLLHNVSIIRNDILAGKEVDPVKELFATVAPPITVKLIATIYGLDFWQLWRENKYMIGVTSSIFYNNSTIDNTIDDQNVNFDPITTEEFFGVKSEDRLYWWREDGDVVIDSKTQKWLDHMAEQHRTHIETMSEDFSAVEWHERLVRFLGRHNDKIKMIEHLYCEFLNSFHIKEYRAWIEMLEVLADNDINECRRLIAVLANQKLREKVFGV